MKINVHPQVIWMLFPSPLPWDRRQMPPLQEKETVE